MFTIDLLKKSVTKPKVTGKLPTPRETFVFSKISNSKNDIAILFGGFQEGGDINDMHILNLKLLKWEHINPIGEIPTPRHGMAFENVGKFLFINGGCNYRAKKCYTETYFLKIKEFAWYKIENT